MGEPQAIIDEGLLKRFVPINALASNSLRQIAKKAIIAEYKPGDQLFRKGDRDGLTIYLLSGEIDLVAGGQSILVEAGSETARHPLGQHQPRQVDAVARSAVSCVQVETNIVDMVLTWQQSAVEVDEIEQDASEDWMTRMLQNRLFMKLPPANIQKIMMSMSDMEVKEGDTIIRQGEEGDYYYYIRSGRCEVLRQPKAGAREVKLAELPAGESFGEEALVSEENRNATVRMLTDGVLMRLAKKDFVKLIHDPLHNIADYYKAEVLASDGAAWIDVRLPDEFANSHINDAINIPLPTLRLQLKQLDKKRPYIVYCDTARRSSTAAFLMSEYGFDAHVLSGGLMNLPPEVFLVSEHKEGANRASAEMVSSQRLRGDPQARESKEKKTEPAQSPKRAEARKKADTGRSGDDGSREQKPSANKAPKKAPVKKQKPAGNSQPGQNATGSTAQEALARAREALEQARRMKRKPAGDAEAPARGSGTGTPAQVADDSAQIDKALEEAEAAKMLLQQELQRLESELANSNTQLEEMLEENQRLEVALAKQETDSEGAAEKRNRENDDWQKKLEQERNRSQQEAAKLKASLEEQLQQEKDRHQRELKQLREQLDTAQKARDQLETDLNAGRQNSEESAQQLLSERSELEQRLRSEGERHAEEIASLKGKVESYRQEKENAEQRREQLEQENRQLRGDAQEQHSVNEELERLRAAAERQTQELTSLDGQLAEAREQRAIAEAAREELQQQIDQVATDLEKTQALNAELDELRQRAESAEGELSVAEKARSEAEERAQQVASTSEQTQAEQQRTREELDFTQRALTKALMEKEELEGKLNEAREQLANEQHERKNQESAASEESVRIRGELDELKDSLQKVTAERDEAQQLYQSADQARREAEEAAESARSDRKARDMELKAELDRLQSEIGDYQSRLDEAQKIREEAERARALAEEQAGKSMAETGQRHEELEGQIQEYQTVLARMEEELDQVGRITEEADSARKQSEGHVQRMAREMERLRNLLKDAEQEKDQAWQARKQAEQEMAQARREAVDAIQKANEQVHKAQEDLTRVRSESESEIQRRLEMETNRFKARDVEPYSAPKDKGPSFHDASTRTEREITLGSERIRDTRTVTGRHKEQKQKKKSSAGMVMFLVLLTVGAVTAFVFKDQLLGALGMAPAGSGVSRDAGTAPESPTSVDETTPEPSAAKSAAPEKASAPKPEPRAKSQAAVRGQQIQDAIRGGGIGPVMMQLPGGQFAMGDKNSTDTTVRPQHTVKLKPFAIGRFEITYDEFDLFAQATGRDLPDDLGRGRGKNPVVNVSWNEARAYAAWLSEQTGHRYRLPSEAEWEYAARAGKSGASWWGNAVGSGNANCFNCGSEWDGVKPAAVGSFRANDFGIHDTAGNVAEWTQDCYHPSYKGAPADGSAWQGGQCLERVVRGGSFASSSKALRSANRERFSMDTRLDNLGFRLVRER